MTRTARLLATVALCLAGMGGASLAPISPASAAQSNGGVKIMPLGDSITDGFNVAGGYRIELWNKLAAGNHTVDFVGSMSNGPASLGDRDHEGHSGWTISQIDAQITGWMRTSQPRTILLHIGTNDMYNASQAPAQLSALLDRITTLAPDTEVFVATLVPFPRNAQNVQGFNAQIPGIVKTRADAGKHVHLVDMSRVTNNDLADGIHPNATGYAKMAAAWYEALVKVPAALAPVGAILPSPTVTAGSLAIS